MPLTPINLAVSFKENAFTGSFNFEGVNFLRLCAGLGLGVWLWAVGKPVNLALMGAATGPAGAGAIPSVTSKLIIPTAPAIGVMSAAFMGCGLNGVTAIPLATIVAKGICNAFTKHGGYLMPTIPMGPGRDVSKIVVANPVTLAAILTGTLAGSFTGAGLSLPMLVTGLSSGICGALMLGTGTATVLGTPSIPTVPVVLPTFSTVV